MSTATCMLNGCARPPLTGTMRKNMLLECCALDWSRIFSGYIGALFSIRPWIRNSAAIWGRTTQASKNILKANSPLFLDEHAG